jgi:hypothetical protein
MLLPWRNLSSLHGLMPAMTEAQEQHRTACQPGLAPAARDALATALFFMANVCHPSGTKQRS